MIDPPRAGTRRSRIAREIVKPAGSPYFGLHPSDWTTRTRELIADHPLQPAQIVSAVLEAWDVLLHDPMPGGLYIGQDFEPNAQTMGLLLHALVPRFIAREVPGWREERTSADMDLVFPADVAFSVEIKTSSHASQIFGNRSYGQLDTGRGKKAKSGYYIAVNFEPWTAANGRQPVVRSIRFGWLDHTDWVAQSASTGQQSSLPSDVENYQLLTIYER